MIQWQYPHIQRIQLSDDKYVDINYDEFWDDPREWGQSTKMCIRKHRNYTFPNELDYNFDCADDDTIYGTREDWTEFTVAENEEDKLKWYHVFSLDCYEHWQISFSLSWTWMQCRWDTSKDCWFIAVPISQYPDSWDARSIAKQDIKIYNQYLNGEVYWFQYCQTFPSHEIDWRTYQTEDDIIDSCYWFYDTKDIAEHLPSEYKDIFLNALN